MFQQLNWTFLPKTIYITFSKLQKILYTQENSGLVTLLYKFIHISDSLFELKYYQKEWLIINVLVRRYKVLLISIAAILLGLEKTFRSSHPRCYVKKVFLKIPQNSHGNTCARVSFLIKLQARGLHLIEKETLSQVFSCEFCEIFKNPFFYRTRLVAASEPSMN